MNEYQASYLALFNAVTDALAALDAQNYGFAKQILTEGQQKSEDLFINTSEKE